MLRVGRATSGPVRPPSFFLFLGVNSFFLDFHAVWPGRGRGPDFTGVQDAARFEREAPTSLDRFFLESSWEKYERRG